MRPGRAQETRWSVSGRRWRRRERVVVTQKSERSVRRVPHGEAGGITSCKKVVIRNLANDRLNAVGMTHVVTIMLESAVAAAAAGAMAPGGVAVVLRV